MGKKLLIVGSAVSLFATGGYACCLFFPLHKVFWKTTLFDALHMLIYAVSVQYNWKMKRVCWFVKKLSSKKDLCENKEKQTTVMLQETQSTWCGPGFTDFVTGGCAAMQCAYFMGIVLILCVVANIIMQGVGLFLIHEYMKKPKKQYRETAFFLNLIGGILMLIAVVLYWPTAILAADSIKLVGGVLDLAFSPADSVGASWAYILLFFFIIIQGVSVLLLANGSNSSEAREAELREQKKFMREQELFNQATEMTSTNYGGYVGVSAPPNHWQPNNWGPAAQQAPPNYGYGTQAPMPMHSGMPHMGASQPAGPYF